MGTLKFEARGDREIVMTRVFDAGRKHVFDALTKPELLKRWPASDKAAVIMPPAP